METGISTIIKRLNRLDKRIQAIPAFSGVMQRATNFKKTLPLISKLQGDYMRQRHWKEFQKRTNIRIPVGTDLQLGDLFAMQLHKFAREVLDIVERAQKEGVIEGQLESLDKQWTSAIKLKFDNLGRKDKPPVAAIVAELEDELTDTDPLIAKQQALAESKPLLEEAIKDANKVPLVSNAHVIFETLEEHHLLIQSIIIGKHHDFFFDRV